MPSKSIPPEIGDYLMQGGLALFCATLSGPMAMISLFGAFVHLTLAGQPRIAYGPVYMSLAAAYFGTKRHWADNLLPAHQIAVRIGIAAALVLRYVFDAYIFPYGGKVAKATGKYSTAMLLVHVQRAMRGADFMCRVYYPTTPRKGAERIPYLMYGMGIAQGIGRFMKLPSFLFSWLRFTQPWCYDADPETAPVAKGAGQDSGMSVPAGKLPVAVFSHGLSGSADLHACLIGEMCSKGWVVLAPDHADGTAAFMQYDDGYKGWYEPLTREQRADRTLEWKRRHEQVRHRVREVAACMDIACELAQERGLPSIKKPAPKAKQSRSDADSKLRVEDGDEVDEDLEDVENDDMKLLKIILGGAIAADDGTAATAGSGGVQVTVIGHSFGGATAFAACEGDSRIGCVVGLDPWAFPLTAATLSRGLGHAAICALVCEGWGIWKENDVAMRLLFDDAYRARYAKEGAVAGTLKIHNSNGIAEDGTVSGDFAAERGDRIHAASTYVCLKSTKHQSFTDFATLAETLARMLGNIGKAPGVDQVDWIRHILLTYPAWHAKWKAAGGHGPAYLPPAAVQDKLFALSADRY